MTVQSEELPRLGRYQVINKIAAGGMAEVFLAKAVGAMGFQRLVAVKLIHANFTRDQEFVKMFIDEARIAMHLHHRNIVQVFDLDRANDTYFIAMEFVHGVNLYDLYERIASKHRWIEPPMALYIIAEVSKGLHFAHTRRGPDGRPLGIVHRDISPQNVLLSFEGEVKITDFGIATAAERLHQTAAGIVKGKYAYMAPERLQEKPTDGRVDVFSTGVLLYEMLVGENPFAGTSAVDTIENVLNKKIATPSDRGAPVSTALDRITMKALAKNPAERYASAQELADAVTEYALELTHARKDMAAGDAALAALLAELFPEKAKRPPVGPADPKSFSLPGVNQGIAVATLDETDPPPTVPPPASRAPQSKRNGRIPELEITQEEDTGGSMAASGHRDPADSQDSDEPTVLRMTPMSEIEALGVPQVTRTPSSEFEDFTTREELNLDMPDLEPLAGAPTIGLRPVSMDDRSMPTPITPLSSDDIDRTAPTELPSMHPPVRKPIVSAVVPKMPVISKGTDPSGPPDDMEDSFAQTLQSQSSVETIDEDGGARLKPQVIVPPVVVPPIHVPRDPAASQVPAGGISASAVPPQSVSVQPVRPIQLSPSMSNRDAGAPRVTGYNPSSQQQQGQFSQQIAPTYSGGPSHGGFGNHPANQTPYPPQSFPPISSGSHDMQLVVPVSSSPDHQSQQSFPPGRIAIPARTSTIIAALLLVIAALVVLAAVLVVRSRDNGATGEKVVVQVTSEPSGAAVTIDGKPQKGATPLATQMVSGETHLFGVTKDGFKPAEVQQTLAVPPEGGSIVVHLVLEPLQQFGSITVQATPPEAIVFVDDKERGAGNVTVGDLPLGKEIVIRVEANGYKTIEQRITLDKDAKDITMPIVLAKGRNPPPAPQPAIKQRKVQLTTEYGTWVNVYLGKKWLGTTPLEATLPLGSVELRVVNETLKLNKTISIQVPEGGPEQINLPIR